MNTPVIVNAEWLSKRLDDPSLSVVDARSPHFYAQAHLPGAFNLPDLFLHGPDGGPPAAEQLARRLGALGISRETHVIAYDEGAETSAGYLFWVLRYYRHPRVSVLDGGITGWRHEGREWEYSAVTPIPTEYEIAESDPAVLATIDDVRAAMESPDAVILDVRSPAEYLGLQITAARNGHIPGAVNLEWTNNLIQEDSGIVHLRPPDELRELYERAGVTADRTAIVHCGSASRSSVPFLALAQLGYTSVKHYVAGWQEWGNRRDTPVEEG